MKSVFVFAVLCLFSISLLTAQEGYKFNITKDIKATGVKDQYRSSTCWSFSGISFLESELMRLGKDEIDLSEMYVVRRAYTQRADQYVRFQGKINFAAGAEFWDVFNVINQNGLMPDAAYPGLCYGETKHIHAEMDAVLKGIVDAIVKNPNKKISPVWKTAFEGALDAYLGKVPENFTVDGKQYNPQTYFQSLGLNLNDYVMITSFTHHPYYSKFVIESPDNWSFGQVYNVQLDEMIDIMKNALDKGFTVGWAADVSEDGFSWKNGIAIVPEKEFDELSDLERAKWQNLDANEKDALVYHFNKPGKEKIVTPDLRQAAFDNYETTDDHGMHITGMAKDQNGTLYFKVKNSWGTAGSKYDGYLFASEAYVRYKTLSIMVHKDAIPRQIAKKLGL